MLVGALCFTPFIDPSIALLVGFVLTLLLGNPFLQFSQRAVHVLLQVSIVGLGFGMNVFEAGKAGKEGLVFTVSSIVVTIVVGLLLGKVFSTGKKTNLLISIGTDIGDFPLGYIKDSWLEGGFFDLRTDKSFQMDELERGRKV